MGISWSPIAKPERPPRLITSIPLPPRPETRYFLVEMSIFAPLVVKTRSRSRGPRLAALAITRSFAPSLSPSTPLPGPVRNFTSFDLKSVTRPSRLASITTSFFPCTTWAPTTSSPSLTRMNFLPVRVDGSVKPPSEQRSAYPAELTARRWFRGGLHDVSSTEPTPVRNRESREIAPITFSPSRNLKIPCTGSP